MNDLLLAIKIVSVITVIIFLIAGIQIADDKKKPLLTFLAAFVLAVILMYYAILLCKWMSEPKNLAAVTNIQIEAKP